MKKRVGETMLRGAAIGIIGLSLSTLYEAAPDVVDRLVGNERNQIQNVLAGNDNQPKTLSNAELEIQPAPSSLEEGLAHNLELLSSSGKNIYTASWDGDFRAVSEILSQDPYLNVKFINRYGNEDGSPLYNAAYKGHVKIAQLLLNNGADPNLGNGSDLQ